MTERPFGNARCPRCNAPSNKHNVYQLCKGCIIEAIDLAKTTGKWTRN